MKREKKRKRIARKIYAAHKNGQVVFAATSPITLELLTKIELPGQDPRYLYAMDRLSTSHEALALIGDLATQCPTKDTRSEDRVSYKP